MNARPPRRRIVLVGVGHTHAFLVRQWIRHPPADVELTCVSDFRVATYSGMLPAVLAGQLPRQAMEIDLPRLCAHAGATLVLDPVCGIDHSRRELRLRNRPPLPFDVLSIGIGSVTSTSDFSVDGQSHVPVKPMQTFLNRLDLAVQRVSDAHPSRPLSVVVVGGGVAGVEITMCLQAYLADRCSVPGIVRIVSKEDRIVPELTRRARELFEDEFASRGTIVVTGRAVSSVQPSRVILDDGTSIDADVVIGAAGAAPPRLLSELGLDLDPRGFIATTDTLESVSSPGVFAVGDSGSILGQDVPKAGVYAVRQGPILWDNVQRSLTNHPLVRYQPQRHFLKLINLGDGRAVGQWRGFAFSGSWVMWLKQRIDAGFVGDYQVAT